MNSVLAEGMRLVSIDYWTNLGKCLQPGVTTRGDIFSACNWIDLMEQKHLKSIFGSDFEARCRPFGPLSGGLGSTTHAIP